MLKKFFCEDKGLAQDSFWRGIPNDTKVNDEMY